MEILWKDTFSVEFLANHLKLYGNCAFPKNVHTRKLGNVLVVYAVCLSNNFGIHYDNIKSYTCFFSRHFLGKYFHVHLYYFKGWKIYYFRVEEITNHTHTHTHTHTHIHTHIQILKWLHFLNMLKKFQLSKKDSWQHFELNNNSTICNTINNLWEFLEFFVD